MAETDESREEDLRRLLTDAIEVQLAALKAGIGFDYVHTDFHQTSANDVLNLSYLVGFEFGS